MLLAGVREVSGEPCGGAREPEQGPNRGAQGTQGTLLQKGEERHVDTLSVSHALSPLSD